MRVKWCYIRALICLSGIQGFEYRKWGPRGAAASVSWRLTKLSSPLYLGFPSCGVAVCTSCALRDGREQTGALPSEVGKKEGQRGLMYLYIESQRHLGGSVFTPRLGMGGPTLGCGGSPRFVILVMPSPLKAPSPHPDAWMGV